MISQKELLEIGLDNLEDRQTYSVILKHIEDRIICFWIPGKVVQCGDYCIENIQIIEALQSTCKNSGWELNYEISYDPFLTKVLTKYKLSISSKKD